MKTLQVGELKTHFSKVIEEVKKGEEIIISYGNKRENVAVIIPYQQFRHRNRITLGLLKDKASFAIRKDFEISPEELLGQ